MQKTFFVSFFILVSSVVFAQSIERKIIIQNGNYYFTTIDELTQLATLHTGKDTSKIKNAKKLAMPAGRNFDDPIIPFCWDVVDTSVYAISFLLHPLNDRNEAIKSMNINSLKEPSKTVTPMDLIMLSVDMNPFAYNDPYLFVTRRSNTIEGFFYDGIAVNDSSYTMAISNNGELSIWNYNGKEWKHSEVMKFPIDGYFSLYAMNGKTYLIHNNGITQEVSVDGVSKAKEDMGARIKDGIIIINKDKKRVYYIENKDLNSQTPLDELINKKALLIF